jgi:hypothetical protein
MGYADDVLALSPRHYWRMGASSGAETDLGSGAANLTVTGATRDVASAALGVDDDGQCSFDGTNDVASASLSLQSATSITIAGWITVGSYANDDRMGFEYSANPNSNAGFSLDLGNSTGGETDTVSVSVTGSGGAGRRRVTFPRSALPATEQHHLAVVYGMAGVVLVYIDGEPVSTTLRDGGTPGGTFEDTTLFLASRNGASLWCPVSWDEVCVFTSVLAAEDIATLALQEPAGPATLYVDADHASASDAGDRDDAQDPDTPLETMQRAIELVVSGDTIRWVKSTGVYAGFTATNEESTATDITIIGPETEDRDDWVSTERWTWVDRVRWKISNVITDGTPGEPPRMYRTVCGDDPTIENWWAKQGGAEILHWSGHFQINAPRIEAPWDSDFAGAYMTGAGFRIGSQYTLDGFQADDLTINDPFFINIGGEDALNLAGLGNDSHTGTVRVVNPYFENVRQAVGATAHTDCIASAGCDRLEIINPEFGPNCESYIIASDGYINEFVLINGKCIGTPLVTGYSVQLSGVRDALIVNSTFANSRFGGLRFYVNSNPVEDPTRLIFNNIIDKYNIDDGWVPTEAEQHHNAILSGPRTDDDLIGFPEFGTSVDTDHELANSGWTSVGINAGFVTGAPTLDRLGRSRNGTLDIGCHESNPAVPVTVDPRPPYLSSLNVTDNDGNSISAVGAVDVYRYTSIEAVMNPRPGTEIDPATVSSSSAFVRDSDGYTIPAIVTLGELDEDSLQTILIDLKYSISPTIQEGKLDLLGEYTIVLTTAIKDTDSPQSVFAGTTTNFRVVGTGQAAITRGLPAIDFPVMMVMRAMPSSSRIAQPISSTLVDRQSSSVTTDKQATEVKIDE